MALLIIGLCFLVPLVAGIAFLAVGGWKQRVYSNMDPESDFAALGDVCEIESLIWTESKTVSSGKNGQNKHCEDCWQYRFDYNDANYMDYEFCKRRGSDRCKD